MINIDKVKTIIFFIHPPLFVISGFHIIIAALMEVIIALSIENRPTTLQLGIVIS